jgi:hypothetical protein
MSVVRAVVVVLDGVVEVEWHTGLVVIVVLAVGRALESNQNQYRLKN